MKGNKAQREGVLGKNSFDLDFDCNFDLDFCILIVTWILILLVI